MNVSERGPRVSVVIPTHNNGAYLESALDSVYRQTYPVHEIIVVDDASSDDTSERMQRHAERVRYLKQAHAGSAVARNRGIMNASGDYVAFLDSDDMWLPEKLDKQISLAVEHPGSVLIYCDFHRSEKLEVDLTSGLAGRKHWQVGSEFQSLLRQNFLHTSSVVVPRAALAASGLFDPKLINAQDWDLWLRLAASGEFRFVDEVLSFYRLHPTQSVRSTKYARNLIFADEIVLARWGGDQRAADQVKAKLREDLWVLGRREWKSGNFARARKAYWRCAGIPGRRIASTARALACSLPQGLLRKLQRSRTPAQGAENGTTGRSRAGDRP